MKQSHLNNPRIEKKEDLKQTLNSMNNFLMSLVMSYVGLKFELLKMSAYTSMKPFWAKVKLYIKKYFSIWHESLPGVEFSSNNQMLRVTSKYIFFTIEFQSSLNFYICSLFCNYIWDPNEFEYLISFKRCIWF